MLTPQPTPEPAPPPSETTLEARAAFSGLWREIEHFVRGVVSLDPQEAAIRAGLSVLVVLAALAALYVLRLLLKAMVARLAPKDAVAEVVAEKKRRIHFSGWTLPLARAAIFVACVLVVLQIWGVNLEAVMRGPLGAVLGIAGRAALIVVLMVAAIEVLQIAVAQLFNRIARRARNARRAAQIRTIAPVVSGVITSVLFVLATMMVLAQIGVEIAPLLAGAGIVGLAIGFGAQTLVKDFLTGIFLIVEDVVSIGDVVRIGQASGVVEDMSLRTIKLRAFDGTLQVIPYGEAQIVYNMTKGFSFYVFDLSISYSSDIGQALELMRETGDAMQRDEAFSSMILEKIEIVGVDRLADSGVMLKARIKTAPGKQWSVGREYLKRIKLAFDAGGVEIPFPHVKLVPPDATQGH